MRRKTTTAAATTATKCTIAIEAKSFTLLHARQGRMLKRRMRLIATKPVLFIWSVVRNCNCKEDFAAAAAEISGRCLPAAFVAWWMGLFYGTNIVSCCSKLYHEEGNPALRAIEISGGNFLREWLTLIGA